MRSVGMNGLFDRAALRVENAFLNTRPRARSTAPQSRARVCVCVCVCVDAGLYSETEQHEHAPRKLYAAGMRTGLMVVRAKRHWHRVGQWLTVQQQQLRRRCGAPVRANPVSLHADTTAAHTRQPGFTCAPQSSRRRRRCPSAGRTHTSEALAGAAAAAAAADASARSAARPSMGAARAAGTLEPATAARASPAWVRWCLARLLLSAKALPHTSHANGFSHVCVRWCTVRWPLSPKALAPRKKGAGRPVGPTALPHRNAQPAAQNRSYQRSQR